MEDIEIYEIIRIENLPYRTYKICKQLGINSLSGIVNYFQENKTFLKTNVCGKKTNQDLINVYKKYTMKIPEKSVPISPQETLSIKDEAYNQAANIKSMTYKINQLNDQQRSIIDNKIEIKSEALSVRGKHAIKSLLQDNFTIENLHNYVFSDKYFNFKNIRNVGKNTIPELNNFLIEIRDEIDKLIKFNKNKITGLADSVDSVNEKLNNEFALSVLQKNFRFKESDYESISAHFLKTKSFPLFKMLDILIQKEYIFNSTELLVFNHILNFTTFENKPVQDVAITAELTGERIRQIKFLLLNNFDSLFSFITIFNKLAKYNVFNPAAPYILVDDDEAEKINSMEGVHFSKIFYINIFALLALDTHKLIGHLSVNISESKVKKIINNDYSLVFKHLTEVFDFNSFIKKIFVLTSKRKTKTLSYRLDNFFQPFFIIDKKEYNEEIFEVCKRILIDNFNIGTDNQGNINFLRNTKKLTFEYLVDILEENKKPMHFVEMYKECIKRGYPIKSDMGVHSTLINHSDIFGLKGAGTFTLRKFGGYFGTIGNVAERYLLEKGKPVPLAEIEKFINKELIISKYSIRMVLFKYKHEGRFILDRNNHVSLKEWSLVTEEKDK